MKKPWKSVSVSAPFEEQQQFYTKTSTEE